MGALKSKVEALLYSSGRRMSLEELSKLCRKDSHSVLEALTELKQDYTDRDSSLIVVDEGNYWKLAVSDDHAPLIRKIISQTELSKTVLETLAVIAFKYPIKQSDLIKIRTNKAYDHLSELEQLGYISRQKHGRSKLIKLTDKFFGYFQLKEEQLREKFRDFHSIAESIEKKEKDIQSQKDEHKKLAKEHKERSEVRQKEIDLIDEQGHPVKLEVVDEQADDTEDGAAKLPPSITPLKDKVGDLEVVNVASDQAGGQYDSGQSISGSDSTDPFADEEPDDDPNNSSSPSSSSSPEEGSPIDDSIVNDRIDEIFNPDGSSKTAPLPEDSAPDQQVQQANSSGSEGIDRPYGEYGSDASEDSAPADSAGHDPYPEDDSYRQGQESGQDEPPLPADSAGHDPYPEDDSYRQGQEPGQDEPPLPADSSLIEEANHDQPGNNADDNDGASPAPGEDQSAQSDYKQHNSRFAEERKEPIPNKMDVSQPEPLPDIEMDDAAMADEEVINYGQDADGSAMPKTYQKRTGRKRKFRNPDWDTVKEDLPKEDRYS